MTRNIQRLHCAVEIDILLGEISNKETSQKNDNACADDLTVHAINRSLRKPIPLLLMNHICAAPFEKTKNVLEHSIILELSQ